jgi:hypothetical protein
VIADGEYEERIGATQAPGLMDIDVTIAYTSSDGPSAKLKRDGAYTLRAVRKVLKNLSKESVVGAGARTLNTARLTTVKKIKTIPAAGDVGEGRIEGFIVATIGAQDLDP